MDRTALALSILPFEPDKIYTSGVSAVVVLHENCQRTDGIEFATLRKVVAGTVKVLVELLDLLGWCRGLGRVKVNVIRNVCLDQNFIPIKS